MIYKYIKGARTMKRYLLRIPDDLYQRVEARSRAWNKPISRLIREALINEYHDTLPIPVELTHPPNPQPPRKVGITSQTATITSTEAEKMGTIIEPLLSSTPINHKQPVRDLGAGRDFRPITKKQAIKERGSAADHQAEEAEK